MPNTDIGKEHVDGVVWCGVHVAISESGLSQSQHRDKVHGH